jgi:hypothetical protein
MNAEAGLYCTVMRRFSDFETFFNRLIDLYPQCIIPPLPRKSVKEKFADDKSPLIEERS